MATIKSFEEIDAWIGARDLTHKIHTLSNRGKFSRDLILKNQICRSALSIMSNIAEGFESQTSVVFIRYLNIAKASAGELRSQLYVALDRAYITSSGFYALCDQSRKISCQIAKLIMYLKTLQV